MKLRYGPEIRKTARLEYVIGGLTFDEIAEKDGMPSARQLRRWAIEENWHEQSPALSAELKFSRRLCLLADKEDKTEKDYKEIDFLTGQICKLNASKNAPSTKKQRDDESQESQSNERKKKKKRIKNDVSSITKEKLDELKNELLYPHQLHWFDNQDHRMRFILKPRQIGATFYFAFEAFYDAVVNGRNKVFISASRDQAEIFKSNIIALCREHFDIELTGSPMTLFVDGKSITPGNVVLLNRDGDSVRVGSGMSGARFLLAAGKPLGEPIAWHGPIVMNTRDELVTAVTDLQTGNFVRSS